MARKTNPTTATSSQPPAAIQAAVDRLTANYRLGQQLIGDTAPGLAKLEQDAAKYPGGVGYSNRQKMRQLATKVSEEVWLDLMKLRFTQTDLPLSWSHLVALASVPTEKQLLKRAEQAADKGWSADNLRRRLQRAAKTGNRRPGTGRTIRKPGSVSEGLQQLLVDLEVVKKRVAVLQVLLAKNSNRSRLADDLVVLERAVEAIRISNETGQYDSVAGSR